MRQRETGFTIIELIVVIILLGILAATALPRFFDVTDDAGKAAVEGLQGNVEMASKLARAAGFAQSITNATAIPMEGANITACNGYPTADADGIVEAAQIAGNLDTIDAAADATGTGVIEWRIADATDPTTCYVRYVAAGGVGVNGTAEAGLGDDTANCNEMGNVPVITSATGGC